MDSHHPKVYRGFRLLFCQTFYLLYEKVPSFGFQCIILKMKYYSQNPLFVNNYGRSNCEAVWTNCFSLVVFFYFFLLLCVSLTCCCCASYNNLSSCRQPIEAHVYISDGHVHFVEFDSSTTAREVCLSALLIKLALI